MPVVKITGQGLSAIALLVALLWYCLLGERAVSRDAALGRAQALQEIRRLRKRILPQPVSSPLPHAGTPAKPVFG